MPYDQRFFDYINSGSIRSAGIIVPLLAHALPVQSVLDVGCGVGAWLAAWRRAGTEDAIGLDGDYVDRTRLLVPEDQFCAVDLKHAFDLGRRFDLAQCLEVAEHLPATSADHLVASLVRHADVVLFSAAVPGQGGDHHVNEQSLEYWRTRFARHAYWSFDYLRPRLLGKTAVKPWYRYNTVLYIRSNRLPSLHSLLHDSLVPEQLALPDFTPWHYRSRLALLRRLPVGAVTRIAKWKERAALYCRSSGFWR